MLAAFCFSTGLCQAKKLFGKSRKNFLVFILIDAVSLHQWWYLKAATQKVVGEGSILVSWYLCASTDSCYFTFTWLFNSEPVHLFNHLYSMRSYLSCHLYHHHYQRWTWPTAFIVTMVSYIHISDIHISINISKIFVGVLIFLQICWHQSHNQDFQHQVCILGSLARKISERICCAGYQSDC